jgi:O-antigen ligase
MLQALRVRPGVSWGDGVPIGLLGAASGCLVGACTVYSAQLGCAVALAGAVVVLFVASPASGMLALWALWLLAPGIRRLFGLLGPYLGADPLSAAPFAATVAIAGIVIARTHLDVRSRRVLGLAAAGLAVGIPLGAANPQAMMYNLIAYGAALLAFVIGRYERARTLEALSLRRALVVGAPLLAVYGLVQYFSTPPKWDRLWLDRIEFGAIGAPEVGKLRIFSALNGPGTLAAVLALALLCYLASKRPRAVVLAAAALATAALALTYVRTTWIAFGVAALVLALLLRTATARLMAAVGAVLVVAALTVGQGNPTTAAFADRLLTFGSLQSDTSANARSNLFTTRTPEAISRPFGHGLGSAGQATKLGGDEELQDPDNGYLSILYQLGPGGFLLFFAALFLAVGPVVRGVIADGRRDREIALLFAVIVFVLVQLAGGDLFYGITGVMIWYLLGRGVAVTQDRTVNASARRAPTLTAAR